MASPARVYQELLLSGLLVSAVFTGGVIPAAATTPDTAPDTAHITSDAEISTVTESDTGNSSSAKNDSTETIRYVDPANVSSTPPGATSLERAGLQIAESLGIRLEVSANELSEQNYTAAESTLGPAYQSDVVQLTEIAEATENASDDELARALESAGTNQRGAINNAEEFQTLYAEYQQARASQNETRAREIARELAATTADLNQTSSNLTAAYAELAELNETQAERAQSQIEEALTRAEQLSQNAQESTYIETTLTIDSVSQEASPTQPVTIAGTLQSANGTLLENRTVELVTPRGTIQTRTNASGAFRLTHTPTQLPAGTPPLTVRYAPRATAGYLGSDTTVSSQILSRTPAVSVNSAPSTLSNGSTASVTGDVSIDGQPRDGVPVRVRLGDTVIGQTETNKTGTFRIPVSVPITTDVGEKTLTVEAGGAGLAVGLTTEQRSVTIEPIETEIELSATRTNNTTVAVSGQLTRVDNRPLAPQLVTITIGDQIVGYLQTDSAGQFASEFTLTDEHPRVDGTEQTVSVSAKFVNETTHLTSAQASTSVTLFPTQGSFGDGIPAAWWGGLGGVVSLLAFGIAIIAWRYWTTESNESTEANSSVVPNSAVPTVNTTESTSESPASLFERAETAIDSTPEQALQVGYLAARRALAEELQTDTDPLLPSATHWEFYQTVEETDAIDTELTTAFESLTMAYERSRYATEPITSVDVRDILETVRSRLSEHTRDNVSSSPHTAGGGVSN